MWIWETGRGVVLPGIQQANSTLCNRGTQRWAKHSAVFFPLETWREEDRKDIGGGRLFFFPGKLIVERWKKDREVLSIWSLVLRLSEHSELLQFKGYEPCSLCVYLSHSLYLGDLPASELYQRLMGLKNSVCGLLVFLSQQLDLPDALS